MNEIQERQITRSVPGQIVLHGVEPGSVIRGDPFGGHSGQRESSEHVVKGDGYATFFAVSRFKIEIRHAAYATVTMEFDGLDEVGLCIFVTQKLREEQALGCAKPEEALEKP